MSVKVDIGGEYKTAADLTPAGAISAYVGTTAPSGWLMCDGTAVSRTTYADLYSVIGNAFGEGDGSTTFNVPDFRGQFLRGVDDGEGTDPDAASRTAMATGGNTGDNVGSVQTDAFQGHWHQFRMDDTSKENGTGEAMNDQDGTDFSSTVAVRNPVTDGSNGTPRTSSETRPTNAYVNYIIKT